MTKEPFASISIKLTRDDIQYLSNLLFTIETDQELRYRLIPASRDSVVEGASAFSRCYCKLHHLLRWFNGATAKVETIQKPIHPRNASYFEPPKAPKRRSSKSKKENDSVDD